MEVKTITLRDISHNIRNNNNQHQNEQLDVFLAEKPKLSNYLIERQHSIIGVKPFVVNLLNRPIGPSTVTLAEHISILNLTSEHKVTLTQNQVNQIEALL